MFEIRVSAKTAKCVKCDAVLQGFEPRIDWTSEDLDWHQGKIRRRYCLECGFKRVKYEASHTAEMLLRAIRVWNMSAERLGLKKKQERLPKPQTTPCARSRCKAEAVQIGKTHDKRQIMLCEQGHWEVA